MRRLEVSEDEGQAYWKDDYEAPWIWFGLKIEPARVQMESAHGA